eukprot:gene9795-6872_t
MGTGASGTPEGRIKQGRGGGSGAVKTWLVLHQPCQASRRNTYCLSAFSGLVWDCSEARPRVDEDNLFPPDYKGNEKYNTRAECHNALSNVKGNDAVANGYCLPGRSLPISSIRKPDEFMTFEPLAGRPFKKEKANTNSHIWRSGNGACREMETHVSGPQPSLCLLQSELYPGLEDLHTQSVSEIEEEDKERCRPFTWFSSSPYCSSLLRTNVQCIPSPKSPYGVRSPPTIQGGKSGGLSKRSHTISGIIGRELQRQASFTCDLRAARPCSMAFKQSNPLTSIYGPPLDETLYWVCCTTKPIFARKKKIQREQLAERYLYQLEKTNDATTSTAQEPRKENLSTIIQWKCVKDLLVYECSFTFQVEKNTDLSLLSHVSFHAAVHSSLLAIFCIYKHRFFFWL